LDEFFVKLKELGKFKAYRGCLGEAHVQFPMMRVYAFYTATAEFDAGDAQFHIALIKQGDNWLISHFTINTPIFLRSQAAPNRSVPANRPSDD
jgi:hypothetical protein